MTREDAINAVADWLQAQGALRVDGAEVRRLYGRHNFAAGWRLPVQFGDRARNLDVLLPATFPNDLTRVALVDRPPFGEWPHIEEDGLLCLPARLTNEGRPLDDVQIALSDAAVLLEDSAAGRNDDDLRDEFHSYWNPTTTGNRRAVSILEPVGPSRRVAVWRGQTLDVVADSETALRQWLGYKNGRTDTHRYSFQRGVLLWLRQLPTPSEYPRHAADVLRIAEAAGGAGVLIDISRVDDQNGTMVILAGDTRNGPVLAGVGLRAAKNVERRNGFRNVPPQIHVARYFAPSVSVERFAVDRADSEWVHGRGVDRRQGILRIRSVVVIGGGSVGAPIAFSLAQAGVGSIDVIDPENLLWGNVGRHPLGAEYVGQNKAEGLVDRIRRSYPHIRHAAGHPRRWEDVARNTPRLLESADLIVSALGDWPSESALNRWHLERSRTRTIVYAWTEAHAAAGHAVAVTRDGGCLRCGFAPDGTPLLRVIEWRREQTLRQEPGCGALFQTYGPIELQHTIALGTELSLDVLLESVRSSTHRAWAASEDYVKRSGGDWTDAWKERGRKGGSVVESFEWPVSATCAACSRR